MAMLIMNQERSELVNLDNVTAITKDTTFEEGKIQYWADTTNDPFKLGEYNNTPEHENLIERIAQSAGAINVFYMPEE